MAVPVKKTICRPTTGSVKSVKRTKNNELSKEEVLSMAIFKAMAESAEAVKASPRYDFSCVTPLFDEGDN